jgi:hypothetical protein
LAITGMIILPRLLSCCPGPAGPGSGCVPACQCCEHDVQGPMTRIADKGANSGQLDSCLGQRPWTGRRTRNHRMLFQLHPAVRVRIRVQERLHFKLDRTWTDPGQCAPGQRKSNQCAPGPRKSAQIQSHSLRFPPGVCRLVQICLIPIVEFASQVQAPVSENLLVLLVDDSQFQLPVLIAHQCGPNTTILNIDKTLLNPE